MHPDGAVVNSTATAASNAQAPRITITISAITGKAVSSSGGVVYDIDTGKSEEIDF